MRQFSDRCCFRLLPTMAVALSLVLGGVSFARDRANADVGLAWFHGSWNLAYIDRGLGVVPGRADITAAAEPGSDEPSINANVRLSHPETGQIYTLTLDTHSIEGDILVLNLNGQSPASEIVEMAGLGETVGEAIPLEIDPGEQLEAAYGGETASATIAPEIPLPQPHQVTVRLTIPEPGEPTPLEGTWSAAYGAAVQMRQGRAGTYDAGEGRASGPETWGRPAPRITAVTDVDMPSQRALAEMYRQNQRRDEGPVWMPPEREAAQAALVAEHGEDAYARFWLRIDGVDLPVQPRREVEVSFDNENIVWTGKHRPNENNPQSLDIEVVLKKELVSGAHALTLNAAPGEWRYDLEPAQIRYLRLVSPAENPEDLPADVATGDERPAQYEAVNELYLGEIFQVELEYLNEPPFDTRQVGSMAGPGDVITYTADKLPDRPSLFRSQPILIDAPQPDAGGASASEDAPGVPAERPAITIAAADGSQLLTTEIDSAVSDRGRMATIAQVFGSPPSLWQRALERAEYCRSQGQSETDVTNYILHELLFEQINPVIGQFRTIWRLFGKGPPLRIVRRVTISLEDHAAAILLRDELATALTDYASGDLQNFGNQAGGTPGLDRRSDAVLNAYTMEMIGAARTALPPKRYDALLHIDVRVPVGAPAVDGSYHIPLIKALGAETNRLMFGDDWVRFFEYAKAAVGEARLELARRADRSVGLATQPTDCQVLEILARVRPAAASIAQRVMPKLLRAPMATEPRLPRLLPDRLARSFVTYVRILASAIKAQTEYSSYDSDMSLLIASGAFAVTSFGVGLSVEAGTGIITAADAVTAAGWTLEALDLGTLAFRDIPAFFHARDDLRFADGLVGIAGREQLEQAKQDAQAAAFTVAAGVALLGGQTALALRSPVKKAVGVVPPGSAVSLPESSAKPITKITDAMNADPYHPDWKRYVGNEPRAVGADVAKPIPESDPPGKKVASGAGDGGNGKSPPAMPVGSDDPLRPIANEPSSSPERLRDDAATLVERMIAEDEALQSMSRQGVEDYIRRNADREGLTPGQLAAEAIVANGGKPVRSNLERALDPGNPQRRAALDSIKTARQHLRNTLGETELAVLTREGEGRISTVKARVAEEARAAELAARREAAPAFQTPAGLSPPAGVFPTRHLVMGDTDSLEQIMSGSGYKATQKYVSAWKVNDLAQRMINGELDWNDPRMVADIPIAIADDGRVIHGHHRVVAAQIASRYTGRNITGGPNPIIPDNRWITEIEYNRKYLPGDNVTAQQTAKPKWRIRVEDTGIEVDLGPRPNNFRTTTNRILREKFPHAFDDEGRVFSVIWNNKVVYIFNKRHVVADELTRSIIESALNGTSRTQQISILSRRGYDPKRFGGDINKAARKWRLDVYNKINNLWLGSAENNQLLGRLIQSYNNNILGGSPRIDLNPNELFLDFIYE